jgi:hypothetical protein
MMPCLAVLLSFVLLQLPHRLWGAGLEAQPPVVLFGNQIRVVAELTEGRLHERYLAIRDGQWVEVAATDPLQTLGAVHLTTAGTTPLSSVVRRVALSDGALAEDFTIGPHSIRRQLTLSKDSPWIRVVTRLEPSGRISLHQMSDRLTFSHKPDWSYSPSVGGFNPDAQYKAPLILVQAGHAALGIVPDLNSLRVEALRRCNHALDLKVNEQLLLSVGFMPARMASHSVYSMDDQRAWEADATVENAYFMLVTASAEPGQAYRQAVRFHWERFGRTEQTRASGQQVGTDARYRALALWDDRRDMVWQKESVEQWLNVPIAGGLTGGGVRTLRWGPGPSIYLSSWFNTLRTSYGMAIYARRVGDAELLARASQTLILALHTPGRKCPRNRASNQS